MSLLYSVVARGQVVLAEFTDASGNFPTVTRLLLGKIDESESKRMSLLQGEHQFHYLVHDGITFLCLTDALGKSEPGKLRLAFSFLDSVRAAFFTAHGERAHSAIAFELNESFAPVLRSQMEGFNSGKADVVGRVNEKLDAVKNVMVQNIEQVLERGEKLELLVDKTDQLNQQAFVFEKSAKRLKNQMWARKMKCYAALAFCVCLIGLAIAMAICNPNFSGCGAGDD